MASRHAAQKIVEIHNQLTKVQVGPAARRFLLDEQRKLWDKEFQGYPFEAIAQSADPKLLLA